MSGKPETRGPNTWRLRVYAGRDPLTKQPRQVTETFHGGIRAAQKRLDQLSAEVAEGRHGGSNATVSQLLDAWLKTARSRISPTTVSIYEDAIAFLKGTSLAAVKLNRLEVHDVDLAYAELREQKVTVHRRIQVHKALRAALYQAMDWGWIRSNPAQRAKKPAVPKKRPGVLSIDDLQEVLVVGNRADPDLAGVILLGYLTGLRRGALCGLKWPDLEWWIVKDKDGNDHKLGELTLRIARVINKGAVIERPMKMREDGEEETLPIGEMAVEVLLRIQGLQQARAQQLRKEWPPDGWVLSYDGCGFEPRRPDKVGKQMSAIGKTAGLQLNPHKLRHSMATEMMKRGVDAGAVAGLLLHADPALTLRVYDHPDQQRARDATAVLEKALAAPAEEAS